MENTLEGRNFSSKVLRGEKIFGKKKKPRREETGMTCKKCLEKMRSLKKNAQRCHQ